MKINKKQWVVLSIYIVLMVFSAFFARERLSQTYYDYYVDRAVWGFFFNAFIFTSILTPIFYILKDKDSEKRQ